MAAAAVVGNLRRALRRTSFNLHRPLSSVTDHADLARSISAELTKLSTTTNAGDSLDNSTLSLHFSDTNLTPSLLKSVLDLSPSLGRHSISFFRFCSLTKLPTDLSLSYLIHYLARRHDFKSLNSILSEYRSVCGPHSFAAAVDRLARSGRPVDAINFHRSFSKPTDRTALNSLLTALADNGFPGHAERVAKAAAQFVFPDSFGCETLVRGYCEKLKLSDAQRLMGEMERGGCDLTTAMYNSVLDCVCRLTRKKDPFRLHGEAEKVLDEMRDRNIMRDGDTFYVLIYNLCKIRKTEDAMKIFRMMGEEWGCSPNAETYLALIKSLYQAARVSEGDEMVGFMRAAGLGDKLDRKAYYGFIKILCGIERVDQAMKVFRMMKGYGHAPGVKSYTLLIGKLASHNQVDRANALFREAVTRGVPVEPLAYRVDKRYAKVKKEKKLKKRPTLPEKMVMKRRRLKKLRLSFVKKPRSMRRII